MKTLLIRAVLTAIVLSGLLAVGMLLRTASLGRAALPEGDAHHFVLGEPVAVERLVGALRFRTLVGDGLSPEESREWEAFHAYLEEVFPAVHANLDREGAGLGSVLYAWEGTEPGREPIVLFARLDVPPVPESEASAWTQPPFSGAVTSGLIWGRGAQQGKASAIAILEAVEGLLEAGFQPRRTVILDFSTEGDAQTSQGASRLAQHLEARGMEPHWVLVPEPGIVAGGVPGVRDPVGVIGTAETGAMTLRLEGSTSGLLSRALDLLEDELYQPRMRGPTQEFYTTLAPHMDPGTRMLVANLWLLGGPVARALSQNEFAAGTLRTGVDSVRVSEEGEALSAEVHLRLVPGDTPEAVRERVLALLSGRGVEIRVFDAGTPDIPPSEVSSSGTDGFQLLRAAIHRTFPDVIAVAPALVPGATDARRYRDITADVYRFAPFRVDLTLEDGSPQVDERIRVTGYLDAVRFYAELLSRASDPG